MYKSGFFLRWFVCLVLGLAIVGCRRAAQIEHPTPTPIQVGGNVLVRGEFVCLPHRDTSGGQTLECALGLLSNDGVYYGLDIQGNFVNRIQVGEKAAVTGILKDAQTNTYKNELVIEVQGVEDIFEQR